MMISKFIRTNTILTFVLLNTQAVRAFNEESDDSKSSIEWLKKIAKDAKDGQEAAKEDIFKKFRPSGLFDDISKQAYEAIESGAPGKIGYGFLMGYSSGFCLKKVIKSFMCINIRFQKSLHFL